MDRKLKKKLRKLKKAKKQLMIQVRADNKKEDIAALSKVKKYIRNIEKIIKEEQYDR